jgi:predicted secreted hydrolase
MAEQQTWQDLQKTFEEFVKPLEKPAADFFENVAETFVGKAETLRDGTEHDPLDLPRDLYAHAAAQTEWWYYTGHFETESGKKFGFELVFFKRRTDLDKFGVVPLRLFGNPIYFAHFALTDVDNKKFRYNHRKSANGLFEYPASASEKHYYVRLGDWSVREANGAHVLRATLGTDTLFEATLTPWKQPVLNGKGGVSFKDEGEASRYFSLTRIKVEGDLTENGETEHFTGSAWMDREFGTWTATERQKGWDWFSIQLDNNCELMCYQLRDSQHRPSDFSSGTFVDENGNTTALTNEDFEIEPTGFWKSPKSGATYPSGWRIKVEKVALDLTVSPVMENQELDTRGTTMIVYWEGACEVSGTAGDAAVTGRAYAELVGYDRSHDAPNIAYFIFGGSVESVFKTN